MYMKIGAEWYEVNPVGWYDEARVDDLDPDLVKKALEDPHRFDPLHKGVNAKGIGSRRNTSDVKNIIAAYHHALKPGADKRAYDRAVVAWKRYKEKARAEFRDLVTSLQNGQITKNQFISRARTLFKNSYEKAYRLGTDAAGLDYLDLPDEDLRWLARARSHEYKFLNKFADDIVAGRGRMDYKQRADMYIDTMDSIFDAGRVDAYPNESTLIYWELGVAEHCGDCIELAMNSPYRPNTLPTTPRAGNTVCLSNCKCRLRIRYENPDQITFDIRPAPSALTKILGLVAVGTAIGRAMQTTRRTTRRTTQRRTDNDLEPEMAGLVVNWNRLDDAVSALTLKRMAGTLTEAEQRARVRLEAIHDYVEACSEFPEWLDPFSRDVYALHAIGAMVLAQLRTKDREGAKTCQ